MVSTLLQWCKLSPYGTSKLAAIRFASPCRVYSVRVFPTGARPFTLAPDIIARTEPEAFFMDVYFNAYAVQSGSQADGKPKPKTSNALIPTVIPYAGGQAEFAVNMGADFATRLMIVRGDFEIISMAIYGEPITDAPPALAPYEPRPLPVLEPIPISPALDLAKSTDPTLLARQLLSRIHGTPPLNLVIRLMFCLKPPGDDWDLPEFPHLYSDLHEEDTDIDLDSAYRCLSRPVADDTPVDALQRFADKVADAIGPMESTQSYFVAGILCRSASQHPGFAQALMQTIELERVFDSSSLDEDTLLALLDASANPDIARFLDSDWFRSVLEAIQAPSGAEREVKKSTRRLAVRLQEWRAFEDALSNPEGDLTGAAQFMRDVSAEEKSLGIWLSCMTTHDDLLSAIHSGPILEGSLHEAPWDMASADVSHAEFLGFVKAYIGIASVMAVYAWSDSLPNDSCREQTLGLLRLWQDVPGYREIVNHLLLLRQMTFRLECMTMDNDPPAMPGIHAENIILNLVNEPHCYLSPHFVKCIRSWQPFSLTYVSEEERVSLDRAAAVADNGLVGAIGQLVGNDSGPFNMDRARVLRVAAALVQHRIDEGEAGDWDVLQTGWKENVHGLFFRTVNLAFEVGQELNKQQLSMSPLKARLQEQLLLLSGQLLLLATHLGSFASITIRTIRRLVDALVYTFATADLIIDTMTGIQSITAAGRHIKQTCLHVLHTFSHLPAADSSRTHSAVILRVLLQKAHDLDVDPQRRTRQIYELVTSLIPTPSTECAESNTKWLLSTLPLVLNDLDNFLCILDVDHKCQVIGHLITLDHGLLNLVEWFMTQELNRMYHISRMVMEGQTEYARLMAQLVVNRHIRVVIQLTDASSPHSNLCTSALSMNLDMPRMIANTMTALLNARVYSDNLLQFARFLASRPVTPDPSLNLSIALTLIRGISVPEIHANVDKSLRQSREILSAIDDTDLALDRLLWELGHCLSIISEIVERLDPSDVQSIVSLLCWLCDKLPGPSDLPGLSWDKWDKLCDAFEGRMDLRGSDSIKTMKGKLMPLPDSSLPTNIIPETIYMSVRDLEMLLQCSMPAPSTPKRKSSAQDILGLVALSPPTALLRSPAIFGLTKTYTRNDFRELRQTPSARQNTSRLPSMHVDEFQLNTSSPIPQPAIGQPPDSFTLGPPFNLG